MLALIAKTSQSVDKSTLHCIHSTTALAFLTYHDTQKRNISALQYDKPCSEITVTVARAWVAVLHYYPRPQRQDRFPACKPNICILYVCMALTGPMAIVDGRHPMVETREDMQFQANDSYMADTSSFHIITGPNMAGKSTYLRQVLHLQHNSLHCLDLREQTAVLHYLSSCAAPAHAWVATELQVFSCNQ